MLKVVFKIASALHEIRRGRRSGRAHHAGSGADRRRRRAPDPSGAAQRGVATGIQLSAGTAAAPSAGPNESPVA
jgi:hypothetical protein